MALYKYAEYLEQIAHEAFDEEYKPGDAAPHSGIYRCTGCGREAASNQGEPLPPQNHHQHTTAQGLIRWRLIVYADHDAK